MAVPAAGPLVLGRSRVLAQDVDFTDFDPDGGGLPVKRPPPISGVYTGTNSELGTPSAIHRPLVTLDARTVQGSPSRAPLSQRPNLGV